MKLEDLRQDVIEDGRSHVFVEVLMGSMERRHGQLLDQLEGAAASSAGGVGIHVLAGRSRETRFWLDQIANAKGITE